MSEMTLLDKAAEAVAIAGWKISTSIRMVDTYTPVNTTMADNAVAKLGEHRKKGKAE